MSDEEDPDRQLMAQVAAGDRQAFATLVARHQAAAWRVARSHAPDDARAEDVLQEAFLGVWRGAAGFRGDASVRGWILGLTRRQAARAYRRHVGEPVEHESLPELGCSAGWGASDPEQLTAALEDRERVRAALDRLAPEDREVLILRDLEQLSGPETAAALDLGLAAMKSRLHRARLRLMTELRQGDRR